jgi:hypothetical protein
MRSLGSRESPIKQQQIRAVHLELLFHALDVPGFTYNLKP